MQGLIKPLRTALNIPGFDVLSETFTIWHTIRRKCFYMSGLIIIYCFSYSISFDPNIVLLDKTFLFITDVAFIAILIQGYLLWHYKENVVIIVKRIVKIHEPRDEIWLTTDAKPIFEESLKNSYKIFRYVLLSRFYFQVLSNVVNSLNFCKIWDHLQYSKYSCHTNDPFNDSWNDLSLSYGNEFHRRPQN